MRTIDLFAGCGGLSLGFQKAGFEVLAAFDNWHPAIEIYRKNFGHPMIALDLAHVDSCSVFEQFTPDMIIGGPPCQDFSSAGKRDESLGRADLTISFTEIVVGVSPKWFVMENVDRIMKSRVLRMSKKLFKRAGYGLTQVVLDASFCDVPQKRKRFFLIGELGGEDDALTPYLNKNLSDVPMTVYDYLGDSLGLEYYYRHPRSYRRRAVFSIYEPSPTIRGVNRPVPKTYKKHPGDAGPVTASLRPLTTIERSYIQTFPKGFVFEGSKTDLEQMIGNAVPVNLARYVADCILAFEHDKETDNVLKTSAELTQLQLL